MGGVRNGIICERKREIERRIGEACSAASPQREAGGVTVVAVTKRIGVEAMREAFGCGIRNFGENYVREAEDKRSRLEGAGECAWHLIGPLQSNKCAAAARTFDWVHSLDRAKVARRLGRERVAAGLGPIRALVQVNLGGEKTKSGIPPEGVPAFIDEAGSVEGVEVRGLMCIPEPGLDPAGRRGRFGQLAALLRRERERCPGLDCLSMGMSADFEEAVIEGATHVRIGTALMGERA